MMPMIDGMRVCPDCGRGFEDRTKYREHVIKHGRIPDGPATPKQEDEQAREMIRE